MILRDTICTAIKERKILRFTYEGRVRMTEPHLLGYDDDGDLTLSAWQLSGGSGQGWRDFHVSKLSLLAIVEGHSEAPRPGYNPRDQTIDWVVCCL
jgi:predicted DNA-binding transcriptional regulator YafY